MDCSEGYTPYLPSAVLAERAAAVAAAASCAIDDARRREPSASSSSADSRSSSLSLPMKRHTLNERRQRSTRSKRRRRHTQCDSAGDSDVGSSARSESVGSSCSSESSTSSERPGLHSRRKSGGRRSSRTDGGRRRSSSATSSSGSDGNGSSDSIDRRRRIQSRQRRRSASRTPGRASPPRTTSARQRSSSVAAVASRRSSGGRVERGYSSANRARGFRDDDRSTISANRSLPRGSSSGFAAASASSSYRRHDRSPSLISSSLGSGRGRERSSSAAVARRAEPEENELESEPGPGGFPAGLFAKSFYERKLEEVAARYGVKDHDSSRAAAGGTALHSSSSWISAGEGASLAGVGATAYSAAYVESGVGTEFTSGIGLGLGSGAAGGPAFASHGAGGAGTVHVLVARPKKHSHVDAALAGACFDRAFGSHQMPMQPSAAAGAFLHASGGNFSSTSSTSSAAAVSAGAEQHMLGTGAFGAVLGQMHAGPMHRGQMHAGPMHQMASHIPAASSATAAVSLSTFAQLVASVLPSLGIQVGAPVGAAHPAGSSLPGTMELPASKLSAQDGFFAPHASWLARGQPSPNNLIAEGRRFSDGDSERRSFGASAHADLNSLDRSRSMASAASASGAAASVGRGRGVVADNASASLLGWNRGSPRSSEVAYSGGALLASYDGRINDKSPDDHGDKDAAADGDDDNADDEDDDEDDPPPRTGVRIRAGGGGASASSSGRSPGSSQRSLARLSQASLAAAMSAAARAAGRRPNSASASAARSPGAGSASASANASFISERGAADGASGGAGTVSARALRHEFDGETDFDGGDLLLRSSSKHSREAGAAGTVRLPLPRRDSSSSSASSSSSSSSVAFHASSAGAWSRSQSSPGSSSRRRPAEARGEFAGIPQEQPAGPAFSASGGWSDSALQRHVPALSSSQTQAAAPVVGRSAAEMPRPPGPPLMRPAPFSRSPSLARPGGLLGLSAGAGTAVPIPSSTQTHSSALPAAATMSAAAGVPPRKAGSDTAIAAFPAGDYVPYTHHSNSSSSAAAVGRKMANQRAPIRGQSVARTPVRGYATATPRSASVGRVLSTPASLSPGTGTSSTGMTPSLLQLKLSMTALSTASAHAAAAAAGGGGGGGGMSTASPSQLPLQVRHVNASESAAAADSATSLSRSRGASPSVRRSSRVSIPPLAHWAGERLVHRDTGEAELVLAVRLDEAAETSDRYTHSRSPGSRSGSVARLSSGHASLMRSRSTGRSVGRGGGKVDADVGMRAPRDLELEDENAVALATMELQRRRGGLPL